MKTPYKNIHNCPWKGLAIILLSALLYAGCESEKKESAIAVQPFNERNTKYGTLYSQYTGSERCQSCHEKEYSDWLGSDHDRAMMKADSASVLANFDTVFTSDGVSSRFFMENNRFFVNTQGPDGQYQDFEVLYTFGIRPLQQYMVQFPGGRLQCLRTAWDTEKKVWFDLYPDTQVELDEFIHWTKGGLNWNMMCSDCHSTLVRKNFAPGKNTYNTTYSIIDVSCESCHGPGQEHVRITESEEYKNAAVKPTNIGKLYMGKATASRQLVDQCARCHSLRTQHTGFYDHEGTYLDHYTPDWLRDDQYFADGQILGEVYVYGSFTQSKMYARGIKCSDCHNSHSLKLKLDGNKLCLQCHVPDKYDSKTHHFHKIETPAAQCISCHMPGRTYMGNDFRRDHSFRVPRPDLSDKYGVPNTCNDAACHGDKTAKWSAEAVVKWYGPNRVKHFSDALAPGRNRTSDAVPALVSVAADTSQPALARSTAIMYLGDIATTDAYNAIVKMLQDQDPIVRNYSAKALEPFPVAAKTTQLAPLLTDEKLSVRVAALGSLIDAPRNSLSTADQTNFDNVFGDYWAGLQLRADFPAGQMEIARYYERTGNQPLAEQAYLKAIDLDNRFNTARMNLANIYYGQSRFADAEKMFLKVIEQEPLFSPAYYSVGLLLAEQGNMERASTYLKTASEMAHNNDRIFYNYGLVLQQLGRNEEAEKAFTEGLKINQVSEANLYALTSLYFNQNRLKEAKVTASRLLKVSPQNQDYIQLLNAINMRLTNGSSQNKP
ncbi:MAG: tetratricopeptide repeat protein [Cyclobacteriaceae bacterium]|nr:tetratricopeptide repeat protein [Cyclobacteriaceae bacterium]